MTIKYIPNVQVEKDLEYKLRDIELMQNKEERKEKLLAYMEFCSVLMGRFPGADKFYDKAIQIYRKEYQHRVDNKERVDML